jgi:hypothetical protein
VNSIIITNNHRATYAIRSASRYVGVAANNERHARAIVRQGLPEAGIAPVLGAITIVEDASGFFDAVREAHNLRPDAPVEVRLS